MIESAIQLNKYKDILVKLKKAYPKEKASYNGFTIDVSFGGNKEPNFSRISLGGVASDLSMNQKFVNLLFTSVRDNISFWEKAAKRDLKEIQDAISRE